MNILHEIGKKSILLIFAVFSLSTNAQLLSDSFQVDNHYRTFHFKKPSSSKTRSSLIFALHGSGGSGKGVMNSATKLEAIAEQENIILVYPDGYKNYWNECRKTASSIANIENIDENAFFDQMIEYFVSKYQVEAAHVFAIGTSGGGHVQLYRIQRL